VGLSEGEKIERGDLMKNPEGKRSSWGILKYVLKKQDRKVWVGFIGAGQRMAPVKTGVNLRVP
jgi:hypothetical protein